MGFQVQYVLLVVFIFGTVVNINGDLADLTCYSCIVSGGTGHDTTCMDNAGASQEIACPNGYCTLQKIVNKEEPDSFWSFHRSCQKDQPVYTDEVIEDSTRISYHQCCRSKNCNIGDGTQHLGKECSPVTATSTEYSMATSHAVNSALFLIALLLSVVFRV